MFSILTGEVQQRGVLDLAGEIAPGCNLIGSYAYLDSEVTKDSQQEFDVDGNVIGVNEGTTGNRLAGTPRHAESLWTSCEREQGYFKGFRVGAGLVARSQNFADQANNDLRLPGYLTAALMLGYEREFGSSKVSFQFNVENLLDKTYFETGEVNTAYYGAPRTFLGSARVEF